MDQWLQRSIQISRMLDGLPETSHKVHIPPRQPPRPVSASAVEMPVSAAGRVTSDLDNGLTRKRGRPRKTQSPATSSQSPAPPLDLSTAGRKRPHGDKDSAPSKRARSDTPAHTGSVISTISTALPIGEQARSHPDNDIGGSKHAGVDSLSSPGPTAPMASIPPVAQPALVAPTASAGSVLPDARHAFMLYPQPYAGFSVIVDPMFLRWQPTNVAAPQSRLSRPPFPVPIPVEKPHPQAAVAVQFRPPASASTSAPASVPAPAAATPAVRATSSSSTRRTTTHSSTSSGGLTIVDLRSLWPRGPITPAALSAATSTQYVCHTHFDPAMHAWVVRSMKNRIDQHYCYIAQRYKPGLRYLNYRIAQLAQGVTASFSTARMPSKEKRQQVRDLRTTVQRALVFHHNVREAVFQELRDRYYAGRNPINSKPSGSLAARLPTLDTWLLHEYIIGQSGPAFFSKKRLETAAQDHDPLKLGGPCSLITVCISLTQRSPRLVEVGEG